MVNFSSLLPAGLPADPALLSTLLDLLPMGVIYYTPVLEAPGTLTDLTLAYLNPAAQRMTQLPAQPGTTYRQQFPTTDENDAWDFHRRSWLAHEPQHLQFYYAADGFDSYFRVTAQRLGEGLLVVFTDTRDEARSQVEEALRESQAVALAARAEVEAQQAELRAVFEQAPVAIALLHGPAHVVEFANTRMAQLWGRPLAQVVGQPHFTALPDLAGQGFEAVFDAVWRTGEPYYLQGQAVTIHRAEQLYQGYFNITYQPSYDGQGQRTGIIASAIEVTDQVRARQHVEQLNLVAQAAREDAEAERQRLYQVLMRMPANIALLRGPEHVYDLVNAEYEQLFPARSPLGRTIREVIPDIEGQGFYELFDRVYETGEPFYQAEAEAWADYAGTGQPQRRYYRTTFEPIRDAQGQVTEVLNFAVDVTTQVEARQQVEQLNTELEARVQARTADLQESEGRFRTMADTAPAMLWVTDPDGQCTYLNAQWYQYTGQTEAEALGMGWTQAVHPDDAALAGQKFLDANARRAHFYIRYRLRRHDGVYRWAVDAGRPHFAEDGAYAGIVGTVIDIHEQQLAEDELHATNEQLRRTNVDLDNFIYTASHDLKAPITNIEGLLLALEHELPAAARLGDVSLMLTMMQDAIERFRRTITHLTDLSRLQKEYNPASDAVALAPVVEAVRLDLGPLLTHTQGQLTVTIPEGLTVTFAEKNLRSVVYNLLSNAFKYHHPDRRPEVHLRSWLADSYAVLEVQDNGLGLDLSQGQEQLFAMFQRLHTHVEGTGIGLYMVKRILENAGGRIEVSSQLGQGSTFRVYFRG